MCITLYFLDNPNTMPKTQPHAGKNITSDVPFSPQNNDTSTPISDSVVHEKLDLDRYIATFAIRREIIDNLYIDACNAVDYINNANYFNYILKMKNFGFAHAQMVQECPGHTFCSELNGCVICGISYLTWKEYYKNI